MIRPKHILTILFLVVYSQVCLSQQEWIPELCINQKKNDSDEKDSLVNLIKSKENPGCWWRDEQSGFADKTRRLVKITSFQEKIDLFNDNSASLKFYLFPSILIENDSVGFELLKRFISDTTELVSFCACMVRDDAIGFRLAYLYYGFIGLKYYLGVNGTIEGIPFWIYHHYGQHSNRKMWRQKLSEFKNIVQGPIPHFKDNLTPSALKTWN